VEDKRHEGNGAKVVLDRYGIEHMSEIGKKGGAATSSDREHMAELGRKGGASLAKDREHMAEIGRRGGRAGLGRSKRDRNDGRTTAQADPQAE
jgi:general stress protein YciG